MELTLLALVVIVFLVPAHVFLRFHYLTRKWKGKRLFHGVDLQPFFQTELHNRLIDSLPLSVVLMAIFVWLYKMLSRIPYVRVPFTYHWLAPLGVVKERTLSLLVALKPEVPALETLHVYDMLMTVTPPLILLICFSIIVGWLTGQVRWNWLERWVHTIPNKWFYVFLQEPNADAINSVIIVEILSKVDRPHQYQCIYRGKLERFILGSDGEPSVVVLRDVERAEIKQALEPGEVVTDRHYEHVALPGTFFTIRYDEIQNLNIRHIDIMPKFESLKRSA